MKKANKLLDEDENFKKSVLKDSMVFLYNENKDANTDTWEWSNSIKTRLARDAVTEDPWAEGLECEWGELSECQSFNGKPIFRRDDFQKNHNTPLGAFLAQMDNGFYPPPEVLLTIADSFKIYFLAQGRISLEEAFFGPSKKGIGNYSARISLFDNYKKFLVAYSLRLSFKNEKRISLPKFAEDYFYNKANPIFEGMKDLEGKDLTIENENHNEEIDIENFLRGFRRWRKTYKENKKKDN